MTKAKSDVKPANLAMALLQVQSTLGEVEKSKPGNHKIKYATEADLLKELKPKLIEAGLVYRIDATFGEVNSVLYYDVTLTVTHAETGEVAKANYPIILDGRNVNPFGSGGALTYGTRYALCKFFGVILEEEGALKHRDPDPEAEGNPIPQGQTRQPQNKYPNAETAALAADLNGMLSTLKWSQQVFHDVTGYQSRAELKTADQYQECIDKIKPWIVAQGAA